MSIRRMRQWIDERGEQYDEDYFTYVFAPGATSDNGVSATLAPGATAIAQIQIQQDSAFEWNYSTVIATDNTNDGAGFSAPNIDIQVTDSGTGRNLFNEPLPVGLVAGSASFPYVLPFPRRFMPKSTVTVTFTNFDTAKTYKLIQFNMIGRKIFMRNGGRPLARFKTLPQLSDQTSKDIGRQVVLAEDYFVYHFAFGALAQGAVSSLAQQLIEADSDFEARLATFGSWSNLSSGQANDFGTFITLTIKDGGSERDLSNAPVMAFDYMGLIANPTLGVLGELSMILPVPRIFLAQTSVIMHAKNQAAATSLAQFDVALAGRKIFELEN